MNVNFRQLFRCPRVESEVTNEGRSFSPNTFIHKINILKKYYRLDKGLFFRLYISVDVERGFGTVGLMHIFRAIHLLISFPRIYHVGFPLKRNDCRFVSAL